MATLMSSASGEAAVGELWTLADDSAGSAVVIAPVRGALVSSFRVAGRELLYLDRATLNDPEKNVRGGIPVLFPSPGKIAGDAWRWGGREGTLKQHGFARNSPWRVASTDADGARAELRLALDSSPATLAQYPWEFRAELTFELCGARLTIAARVTNLSRSQMPFALGYHPYFLAQDKARARIDTQATRAFDNLSKRTVEFTGFDLTLPEVDLHLLDHGSSASALHFADGSRVELRSSPDFAIWVVWTLGGKDFVCLEPWTAPGNALNTGERLSVLEPGATLGARLEIELVNSG